jgi:hypothetical protein
MVWAVEVSSRPTKLWPLSSRKNFNALNTKPNFSITDLFLNVCPLAGVGHVGLGLPELGQVERGDLLCLFDLLLVASDLGLKLVNQALHTARYNF